MVRQLSGTVMKVCFPRGYSKFFLGKRLDCKDTSESDPHSYEVTLVVKNSPENILRLQFCWSVYNWLLSCWNRLQTSVKWFFLSLFFLLWKDDQIFLSGRQPLVNWAKTCIAKFNVMVSTLKYSVSFLVYDCYTGHLLYICSVEGLMPGM